jgi:hypothetical protein
LGILKKMKNRFSHSREICIMGKKRNSAMKSDRNLVAYCGLYCGDCPGYKRDIADLSKELRKKIRESRLDKASKFLAQIEKGYKNFDKCYEVLGLMMKMRCKKVCRERVRVPSCAIRKCCIEKNFEGCWECEEFETCKKPDWLKPVHGDAHIKNLRRIKRNGINGFLRGKRDW